MKYHKNKTASLSIILLCCLTACATKDAAKQQFDRPSPTNVSGKLQSQPNILWLVTEDMSPYLPAYGDHTVETPNITELANEGVTFANVFSPSGVCAPSRAALATGLYPSSIGANHMRTTSYMHVTGLPRYGAVPGPEVKMLSEYLRAQGYYTTNNFKTDYQFKAPVTAWDESGPLAHWRNRGSDQPFFSVINFTVTHESGLFEPYRFKQIERRHALAYDPKKVKALPKGMMNEAEIPSHIPKNLSFNIPPYLPDTKEVRRDMWKMYNNIVEMDKQVGHVLQQLKQDGLLDNTIIFFYADHGGPLPRQKRLIYDSGLQVPLIVRFPSKLLAGSKDDQLISFIDFPPTVMKLAGVTPPSYLHGKDFLQNTQQRKYVHAAADRFDGFTDAIRAVRDKRYKYIRNYRPEQGYYLPIEYRENIPSMQVLLELRDKGELNAIQQQWFRNQKAPEELFDTLNDPHELRNLAADPSFKKDLVRLRTEMDRWLTAIGDKPNTPEAELLATLWQGKTEQPVTHIPKVVIENKQALISSETPGASIGYQIVDPKQAQATSKVWHLYQGPIKVEQGRQLRIQAHRIGFKPSETVVVNL